MEEINIHRIQTQVNIDSDERTYHLPIASETTLGGIKVGDNLSITEDGTLSAVGEGYELPVASASRLGGIKVGAGLQINNSVLTPVVDTIMSAVSANPLTNATITSTINTINSDITGITSRVEDLETSNGDIINSISGIEGNITSLDDAVDELSDDLSDLSSTVSGYSSSISQNTDDITSLSGRMTTAEDDIDTIEGNITTINGNITDLSAFNETVITYSYLLPVSTWTTGQLTYEKRGKMGVIYFDLQGSLQLAGGGTTVLHTFSGIELYTNASSVLLTDDGPVLASIDSSTGELSLTNLANNNQTITNLQGSIPLVF